MNYVNNGDYYLVAKYNDFGIDIIPINKKWYLGDKIKDDNKSYKNDISSIDIVTTKFKNEQQMKKQMYKNGYIKTNCFRSHTIAASSRFTTARRF